MYEHVREQAVVAAVPKQLLIGSDWRDAASSAEFAVEDPSTGLTRCTVANASPPDRLAALERAIGARGAWSATPPSPTLWRRSVVKQSGLGRDGGRIGIEEFLEVKYVNINVE